MLNKPLKRNHILFIILIGVLFAWALNNLHIIWSSILFVSNLLMPIFVGLALAFILDVFVDVIESKILISKPDHPKYTKIRRPLSVFLSVIIFIGIIGVIVVVILPKALESVQDFATKVPQNIENLTKTINDYSEKHPAIKNWMNSANFKPENISNEITKFFTGFLPKALTSLLQYTSKIVSATFTVFLGFVFAIYFLLEKEKIVRGLLRFFTAFTSQRFTKRITKIITLSTKAFKNFVMGQMLESIICGTLTYIVLRIFNIPQALLVSFITGVGALIPMFGAIFAGLIGGLIIFIISPIQALIGVILIAVVVQIDGNFIYPHVAGNRLGIPPLVLLFAVTVLGSMFGLTGMILGVPLMSIIYALINEEITSRLEDKRKIERISHGDIQPIRIKRKIRKKKSTD